MRSVQRASCVVAMSTVVSSNVCRRHIVACLRRSAVSLFTVYETRNGTDPPETCNPEMMFDKLGRPSGYLCSTYAVKRLDSLSVSIVMNVSVCVSARISREPLDAEDKRIHQYVNNCIQCVSCHSYIVLLAVVAGKWRKFCTNS